MKKCLSTYEFRRLVGRWRVVIVKHGIEDTAEGSDFFRLTGVMWVSVVRVMAVVGVAVCVGQLGRLTRPEMTKLQSAVGQSGVDALVASPLWDDLDVGEIKIRLLD